MGFGSPLHWIVLILVVVLLFGGGRVSSLMGDVAKGIKSFKKGLADDEDDVASAKPAPRVPTRNVRRPNALMGESFLRWALPILARGHARPRRTGPAWRRPRRRRANRPPARPARATRRRPTARPG